MKIDKHKKMKSENAESLCTMKMKARTGGRREDTCDHGLSKRSLGVKPVVS